MKVKGKASLALALAILLYPVIVYFGIQLLDALVLAAVILGLTAGRAFTSPSLVTWLLLLVAASIFVGVLFFPTPITLKLYPTFVNLALFLVFFSSLYFPPTVIERFARMSDPNLSQAGIHYTRWVTKVWCLFFLVNGVISSATVMMSNEVWALYNGLVAYIAMGSLFAIEFAFRHFYKKRHT